jgi:hypothetical protein
MAKYKCYYLKFELTESFNYWAPIVITRPDKNRTGMIRNQFPLKKPVNRIAINVITSHDIKARFLDLLTSDVRIKNGKMRVFASKIAS